MPVDISQVTQEELAQVAAEVTNQASSNQQKRKVVEAAANELSTEEQEALAIRIYENATGGRFHRTRSIGDLSSNGGLVPCF